MPLNHHGNPLIDLHRCLEGGQAFHWKCLPWNGKQSTMMWASALHGHIVCLRYEYVKRDGSCIDGDAVEHKTVVFMVATLSSHEPSEHQSILHGMHEYLVLYFRLKEANLGQLLETWRQSDITGHFRKLHPVNLGLYLLSQEPFLVMLSFICSANNHISRITKMVQNLQLKYGAYLGHIDGVDFHSFPELNSFGSSETVEQDLRELGFGYRARYIATTIKQLQDQFGCDHSSMNRWFLTELACNKVPYADVVDKLVRFSGIGRKVADCIALFSLNKLHVVPMDTHMIGIARRHYGFPCTIQKITTPANYERASRAFSDVFPESTGWAHLFLYVSDLNMTSKQ